MGVYQTHLSPKLYITQFKYPRQELVFLLAHLLRLMLVLKHQSIQSATHHDPPLSATKIRTHS